MSTPCLEMRSVTKAFGGLVAVNDVSFSVAQGEFLGVSGPNGSGKSTLFNVITGIPYNLTSGQILFDGTPIETQHPRLRAQNGIARTFQTDTDFGVLTPRETCELAVTYGRKTNSETALRDDVEEALDFVEFLPKKRGAESAGISVYERKQLMIASALTMKPKVLMLDEPASGLTGPEIKKLDNLLIRLNGQGLTIILIEHVLSLLLSVSQRLIVLNEGTMIANGDPQEVITNPEVVTAYLGGRST